MNTMEFVAGWALRSSLLILSGALLLWTLRTRDASVKLAAWTALLFGSLAIPFLGAVLPPLPLVMTHAQVRAAVPAPFQTNLVTDTDSDASITPVAPAPHSFDWQRLAMSLYAGIAGVLLLRICVGLLLSRRLARASSATNLAGVRESDQVNAPVTVGIAHPAILLPLDWREWDPVKLEAVLAHERSHIRRRDPAVQLLSAMHRAVLWISPLSWMLDRWIVRAAEEASDDDAVAATANRVAYAEILLGFLAQRSRQTYGIAMARYGRPDKRIDRILDETSVSRRLARGSAAAIVILACPLAYLAAATSMQKAQVIHFPALPAAPPAPQLIQSAPVQIAQAPAPAPQTQPAPPTMPLTFDVVSIKSLGPGGGGRGPGNGPPQCLPLRYTTGMVAGSATAAKLIQDAYGLSPHQVSGEPSWVDSDRYCIEAKSVGPAEKPELVLMLQAMLADRFKLVAQHETKEMPVYIMTLAKKGLLFERKPGEPTTGGVNFRDLEAAGYKFRTQLDQSMPTKALVTWGATQHLAELLSDFPLDLDRPVVDKTGLQGNYTFAMRWTGDDFRGALEEQFGLKLEPGKAPLPAVSIESIQRPDAN